MTGNRTSSSELRVAPKTQTLNDTNGRPRDPRPASRSVGESSVEAPLPDIVVGTLKGFDESGAPQVDFAAAAGLVRARATVELTEQHTGSQVALIFESGDPLKPIVLGVIRPLAAHRSASPRPLEASLDGERLTLNAEREIVLRCGKASITLTRAGKVLIQGEYVASRSTGVNRIYGGSVQIN